MRHGMLRALATVVVAGCGFTTGGAPGDGSVTDVGGGPDGPLGDRDGDGVNDGVDNCVDVTNPAQADEDTDGVGNACDNCPHVANTNQTNTGELANGQAADGVGDACDPMPADSGQSIALFMPFDSASEIAGWQVGGTADFVVASGQLEQRSATDLAILWKNDLGFAEAWIATEVTYDTVDETKQFRGAAVMTRFLRTTTFGWGVGCGEMRDSAANGGAAFYNIMKFDGSGFQNTIDSSGATVQAGHTATYRVHRTSGSNHECVISPSTNFTRSINLAEQDGTGINLAVWGATVRFKYLVVID